mmetsp:Transcript_27323/g.30431  ORF Transcript_27323/g.30431 Transcript_27323/m.30431 type:complete len:370 (+) Transcript_27323:36-1145(+)
MRTCIYYFIGVILLGSCYAKNEVMSSSIYLEASGDNIASLHVMINFQVGVVKSTIIGPRDKQVSFGFMSDKEVLYEWVLSNGTVLEYNTWINGGRLLQVQQDLSIALIPQDEGDVTVTFYRALETSDDLDFQFTDDMGSKLTCYWSIGDGLESGSKELIFLESYSLESSSISGGAIAGIVISATLVIMVVIAIVITLYFCWVKKEKPRILSETTQTPPPRMYVTNVSNKKNETTSRITNEDITSKSKVVSVDNGPNSTTREDTTTGGSSGIKSGTEENSESSGTLASVIEEQYVTGGLALSSSPGSSIACSVSESGTAVPEPTSSIVSETPSSMRSYSVSVSESLTPSGQSTQSNQSDSSSSSSESDDL